MPPSFRHLPQPGKCGQYAFPIITDGLRSIYIRNLPARLMDETAFLNPRYFTDTLICCMTSFLGGNVIVATPEATIALFAPTREKPA